MARAASEQYIEPPARLAVTPAALPYSRGLESAENQRPTADEIAYHPVTALQGAFDDTWAHDLLQRALRVPKAMDRLNRGRVARIAVSRRGEGDAKNPSRRPRLCLVLVLVPIFVSIRFTSVAGAQDFGPDTCVSGFVWREAFPGDHVCVDAAARAQAATDNRLAARRRQPGGGAYGPNTCRAGFVWREARAEDQVCVTQETRTQVANDNRLAASRYVRSQVSSGRGRLGAAAGTIAGRAAELDRGSTAVSPGRVSPSFQVPPVRSESGSRGRGFDDQGNPYVEDILPDGSKRRIQRDGVTIIRPDGTSQYVPSQIIRSNVQPPTPPQLPESGMA